MKKNNVFIIISILLLIFTIIYSNNRYNKKEKHTYQNAYYSIANIDKYVVETRARYYIYSYTFNKITYYGQKKSNGKIDEGSKKLVMFNKNRISESFLFENTIIPEEYLNKDTIWITPPNFIDPEDLKFLND
ncbi:hypothetical protein ACTS9T_04965 [Empedobacter falsenii]